MAALNPDDGGVIEVLSSDSDDGNDADDNLGGDAARVAGLSIDGLGKEQERRVKARHDQQPPPGPPPPPPPQQEVQPPQGPQQKQQPKPPPPQPQQQIQQPPPEHPQPPPPLPMPPRRQAAPTAPVYAPYPTIVPPYRRPPQPFQPPQQPPPPCSLQPPPRPSPPQLLHLPAYQRNPFALFQPPRQQPLISAGFIPYHSTLPPPPLIPAGFIPYHSTLAPPHGPQIRSFLPYPFAPYLPQQAPRPRPLYHIPFPRPSIEQLLDMPDIPLRLRVPGQQLYQLCRKQLSTSDIQGALTISGPNGNVLKDMAQQAGIHLPIRVNVLILYGPVRRRSTDLLSSDPEGGLTLAWSLLPVFRFVRNQWVNVWFELNPPTINIYIRVDHR